MAPRIARKKKATKSSDKSRAETTNDMAPKISLRKAKKMLLKQFNLVYLPTKTGGGAFSTPNG